jgi:predicted component of type VI protein secretion system
MNREPEFLTREIVEAIHQDQIETRGAQAALVFLEGCGIDTSQLPEQRTYEAMIKIATHEMGRSDLAEYFRSMLARPAEA